jgi:uncharacterized membrane protein YesL
MSSFFNMDNGFFTALGKICDIIFLSAIWVLICIPVVTIGPANTALYYATVKVIRRERGYLFREFFKSFRLNFAKGAIVGVILTIMFIILGLDLLTAWANLAGSSTMNSVFFGVYVAITFLLVCFSIYVFPILSRFDMKVGQLLKASAFMSMRHLPFTIVMVAVQVAAIIGAIYIPILIFVLPATVAFINSHLMERILKKYMPKPEDANQSADQSAENETEHSPAKDEWYLE